MTLDAAVELLEQSKKVFEQDNNLNLLVEEAKAAGVPPSLVYSAAFEEQCRVALSDACHSFANTGAWLPLPAAQQLLVYERLKAARRLLWAFQNVAGTSPIGIVPEAERTSLLSFLLVDYWAMIALEGWQLKYRGTG